MATTDKTKCSVCGVKVEMMTFKGTGVCSELCRKVRDGEITNEQRLALRNNVPAVTRVRGGDPRGIV